MEHKTENMKRNNTVKQTATHVFIGLIFACAAQAETPYVPVKWTKFVKVDGQSEPVPEQWLQDPEAKIAYSLKLPESVPKSVPFNFLKAGWWSIFGGAMKARALPRQKTEAWVSASALNTMTNLGMPVSVKI
jgi:hypothetical protein